ncbi:MAG TPA: hypothetical protein IAD28_02245 [Candidatus Faeciplasma avium]|uniref:Uncharacterized protein n=1 Tax=Candidatus Faeciplasma avium TaxID=2840798 RepID=A0A9D1NPK3_9FIRM|nr:hypothetical protein [Candidatus Faeciplasma avium]
MNMNIPSLCKGITIGIVTGAAVYAVSNATRAERRHLKSSTIRAVRSISSMLEGLGSMFV